MRSATVVWTRRCVRRLFWSSLAVCVPALAACGGSTIIDPPSTTTTSGTTTIAPPPSQTSSHYIGTITPPGQPTVPIDLSIFFGLPRGASVTLRPMAITRDVLPGSGYDTGPNSFRGTIEGTLEGTPDDGTFRGILTATLSNGCVASRKYSGPLTAQGVNWSPGDQINTCGGATPLTFQASIAAASQPPTVRSTTTTSGPSSSTTTTSTGSSTTTTSAGSSTTTTTGPSTTTTSAISSTTTTTSTSSSTTTITSTSTTTTSAPAFAVTAAVARVSPSAYSGGCPGTFNFSADITANGAGSVSYRWERSDEVTGTTQTLSFNGAGTQPAAAASWQLSANGSFWERLHVLTPNDLLSNQATFTNSCTPQSDLVFSFSPSPAPPDPSPNTSCSGGSQPFKTWHYRITIQNASNVPFTISSWTTNSPQGINSTHSAAQFGQTFGTSTIAANGSASGSWCVWFTTATSGTVSHTFTGTNGNGPFTTPSLTLSP